MAIEAIGRAVELDPENSVYKANQAYIECVFGEPVRAWQLFSELPPDHKLSSVYLPRRALALVAAYATAPETFSIDMVRKTVQEALDLGASSVGRALRAELQMFLDSISVS